jgi:hypothetical protein
MAMAKRTVVSAFFKKLAARDDAVCWDILSPIISVLDF